MKITFGNWIRNVCPTDGRGHFMYAVQLSINANGREHSLDNNGTT